MGLLERSCEAERARIIQVAARLGIADHLAGGPRTSTELAAATDTHAPSLHRLLRALAGLGVLVEVEAGRFELTRAAQPMRAGVPGSVRNLLMLRGSDEWWRAWGELEYTIRTGKPAWEKVTGACPFDYLADRPEQRATFNGAMSDRTRAVAATLVAGYDFTRFGTLVDVGGGNGTLIAAILAAAPGLWGVLYDLPGGLEAAAEVLEAAGVADRCRVQPGDFFTEVPAGADAYLMKNVLHDWDDEQAVAILRNCRAAMAPESVLLVVEPVLPERVADPFVDAANLIGDITMLVVAGGRERTEREFAALYAEAGLELKELVGPLDGYWIIAGSVSSTE